MNFNKQNWASKSQELGRAVRAYSDFTNKNQTPIAISISLFFLLTFTLAATIFRYPFPTTDYLFWVSQNANDWPSTLLIPYNQHILVLPKLLVHLDIGIFHGNTLAAVIFAVSFVISITILIMLQIARVVRRPGNRLMIFAALCVSILRGVEIYVVSYPSNINHVFVVFFFVAGISVIFADWAHYRPLAALTAVILFSLCTVGSAANGLAALPVFLLFFHYNFRWRAGSIVYGLFALFLIAAYLSDLRSVNAVSTVAVHLPSPWTIFRFMLNFAGAPWKIGAVNFSNGTYVGGILTLVVGLRTSWRFLRSRIEPWSLVPRVIHNTG